MSNGQLLSSLMKVGVALKRIKKLIFSPKKRHGAKVNKKVNFQQVNDSKVDRMVNFSDLKKARR